MQLILRLTGFTERPYFDNELGKPPVHLSMSCNHRNPFVCPLSENNLQNGDALSYEANHCRVCTRCITACPFQAPKLNPTNRADNAIFGGKIDEGLSRSRKTA